MLRCTNRSTSIRRRCLLYRLHSSSQEGTASSSTGVDAPITVSRVIDISHVRSRRVWQKLHQKPKVESAKAKPKEEEKPWPKNVVYGAAGVASIVVPYSLIWIVVSVPELRTLLLSKSQVEYLRGHFGTPEPEHVSYPEILNSQGVTDPLRIPAVLPGEGSPRQEANAEAIENRLGAEVRVELTVSSPSESINDLQSTVCLKLPGSERANRESLLRHCRGLAAADSANSHVSLSFSEDDGDNSTTLDGSSFVETLSSEDREASDVADDASAATKQLLRRIAIYSLWHYQPPINVDASRGKSSASRTHPVTSQFTNEELQIRQLEAEIARLRVELQDVHSTRPFDDIRDELVMCQAQLRRLKWKRWVPWW